MKVLLVGSGGREHALAWRLAREPGVDQVVAAPGSAGIASVAECAPVAAHDIAGLARLAEEIGADLTLVGPEAPLAAGIVDEFRKRGLNIFGPDRRGASLEASKAFAKAVLVEAGVPTAEYAEFEDASSAKAYARASGCPLVIKADGLAAGKGVVICRDQAEAAAAIDSMLCARRFGDAGSKIIVEEFLVGEEASFMALTDGRTSLCLAGSQDHKAVFDGDRGPNTGGMGAYSPAPVVDADMADRIGRDVIEPTVEALRRRGIEYRGVLYAGLMIADGQPKVLEYNVRFGDPECQVLMTRMQTGPALLARACLEGRLHECRVEWSSQTSVCVVMASEGYPGEYRKGLPIHGIEEAGRMEGVEVFHAGTARGPRGGWQTAGGRVLGVTALGKDMRSATARAYAAVDKISWEGAHFRRDIGHRALHAADSAATEVDL